MNIKLLLYFIIIVLGFVFASGNDPLGRKRKGYVFLIIALLVLESSLRHISVGPDTIHYYNSFSSVSFMSWSDALGFFKTAYLEGEGKDPGFVIFMKFVPNCLHEVCFPVTAVYEKRVEFAYARIFHHVLYGGQYMTVWRTLH